MRVRMHLIRNLNSGLKLTLQIQGAISEYEREKITKNARDGSLYAKLAKSSCRQRPKAERIPPLIATFRPN